MSKLLGGKKKQKQKRGSAGVSAAVAGRGQKCPIFQRVCAPVVWIHTVLEVSSVHPAAREGNGWLDGQWHCRGAAARAPSDTGLGALLLRDASPGLKVAAK